MGGCSSTDPLTEGRRLLHTGDVVRAVQYFEESNQYEARQELFRLATKYAKHADHQTAQKLFLKSTASFGRIDDEFGDHYNSNLLLDVARYFRDQKDSVTALNVLLTNGTFLSFDASREIRNSLIQEICVGDSTIEKEVQNVLEFLIRDDQPIRAAELYLETKIHHL